jgi:hypothetical protein
MDMRIKEKLPLALLDTVALITFIAAACLVELALITAFFSGVVSLFRFGPSIASGVALLPFIIAALVFLMVACAWIVAVFYLCDIAEAKGADTRGLQLVGILASPLLLALIVIALPHKTEIATQVVPVTQQTQPPITHPSIF